MAENGEIKYESFLPPYIYEGDDTRPGYISPFNVNVTGLSGELLGIGRVIGQVLDDSDEEIPVIAIQDPSRGYSDIIITGEICNWEPFDLESGDPEYIKAVLDNLVENCDQIMYASTYKQKSELTD